VPAYSNLTVFWPSLFVLQHSQSFTFLIFILMDHWLKWQLALALSLVIYALFQDRRRRFITFFVLCYIQELWLLPNKVSLSSSKKSTISITEAVVNRYINHVAHFISALAAEFQSIYSHHPFPDIPARNRSF